MLINIVQCFQKETLMLLTCYSILLLFEHYLSQIILEKFPVHCCYRKSHKDLSGVLLKMHSENILVKLDHEKGEYATCTNPGHVESWSIDQDSGIARSNRARCSNRNAPQRRVHVHPSPTMDLGYNEKFGTPRCPDMALSGFLC